MKKILLILFLLLFSSAQAQQKELSLEEDVLSRSKGLTPKNITRLQWIDGTNNYIYLEDESYMIQTASGKKVSSFDIDKFEKAFPTLKT